MFEGNEVKNVVALTVLGLSGAVFVQMIGMQGMCSQISHVFQDSFNTLMSAFEDTVIHYVFDGRPFEMASIN